MDLYDKIFLIKNFFLKKKISVSYETLNLLVNRCNGNRGYLKNELEKIIPIDLKKIKLNQSKYSFLTNEKGGIYDDLIVTKVEKGFNIILNAACKNNDFKIISGSLKNKFKITLHKNLSLIALQGPKSSQILEKIISGVSSLKFMNGNKFSYNSRDVYITRSGYTGEDGFEIMFNNSKVDEILNYIVSNEIKPCGLGSRDTLRLEASLPLYGFELTEEISPVEANLKWVITNEDDYLGKDVLDNELNSNNHKALKKFIINSKNIARTGTKVKNNNINGVVSSGNYSPILEKSIGFALFDSSPESDLLEFDIRGNFIEGNIINKRFLS